MQQSVSPGSNIDINPLSLISHVTIITNEITVGTFSVINVIANTSGPQCVYYNDDSPAIGCVVHLIYATPDVTYCRVLGKTNNTSVNPSLCNSSYSNGPLSAGMYIVDAYDIGSDGNVSELPAISGVTLHWSTALQSYFR